MKAGEDGGAGVGGRGVGGKGGECSPEMAGLLGAGGGRDEEYAFRSPADVKG